ncbi:RAS guanyl-releasing protein 4 isoform X1 [Scleropages formosus]|uniref:RAS guanyl-releasing protein 4 isoform X1 n=3 Tax=Scleropages formosus TaxID=113540 RepID=UPI0010FAAD6C|nr:RAS guanyl-releasing protein 1-like isoform X1 [Scleropages formosus]
MLRRESRKSRKVQRRMTCPSPREILRVLETPPTSTVRATTLDELIQQSLHCFDSDGKLSAGTDLVHMTLMMHSWVVPSHTFARKLLSLYKDCPTDRRARQQLQICHLIRQWISQFPAVFEGDPLLEQVMRELRVLVKAEGHESHCQLIDTSYLDPPVKSSQGPSPRVKKRKVSLLFDHMEPDEMAELLTYLEFEHFCKVSYLDYRSYVVRGSVRGNPALELSVMLCNGVSQWVQLMILSKHTPQQRAQVFIKFIHVAQKLRALQNFNTLMAVTGGLCHSAISRLKETACLLPPDVTKTLSEMTELLSSYSNYSTYRRVYSESTGFKVPILGVHLKDLISLNEALPNYLEEDKINLSKLQHLYSNISELLAVHACTPPFEPNKDLLHLLTLSLDLYYTEDEIYELSYAKEPKRNTVQPAVPVKPPVIIEWGSEVTLRLDPDTISKHVQQMVDSVMKNYDLDFDGYISLEDFEKIAANFPFSFCTHESDREGEISREEITSYFMRGMSICAKLGFNFQHNFHEMTYKKPTFCDSCGGFLWGVIKQGYHCRDCGANCHKHCRGQVGLECMKRFKISSGGSCPCTPAPEIKAKGSSWSSEEDTFVFPQGQGAETAEDKAALQENGEISKHLDQSTQTEPGVWTPAHRDRKPSCISTDIPGSLEKDRNISCVPLQQRQRQQDRSPARQRAQNPIVPTSFLLEKMEELHLHKDKGRAPD